MPELTFDPSTHAYFVDGKEVPGVSRIIEKVFNNAYTGDPWYGERGKAIHLATQYLEEGTLDESSLDPQHVKPYIDQYKRFLSELKAKSIFIEKPLYSQVHQYAGTLDRVWIIDGKRVIGDIKTGSHTKYHIYQLAAYEVLYSENYTNEPVEGRFALYLRPDSYKLKDLTSKISAYKWTSIMDVYRLMTE